MYDFLFCPLTSTFVLSVFRPCCLFGQSVANMISVFLFLVFSWSVRSRHFCASCFSPLSSLWSARDVFFYPFFSFFPVFFVVVVVADAGSGGGSVPPVRGLPRQRYPRHNVCSSSPSSVFEGIGHELTLPTLEAGATLGTSGLGRFPCC